MDSQNQIVTMYFVIDHDGESKHSPTLENEHEAYENIRKLLKPYSVNSKLDNEGHDCSGGLVCKFLVKKSMLPQLQAFIKKNHGGGDDIIYLDYEFQANCFEILEHPGVSVPIPFDDWDDYLEPQRENKDSSNSKTISPTDNTKENQ